METVLYIIQIYLLVAGCVKIKRNILDISGYLNILFVVFFALPAWDLYYEWGTFSHIINRYDVYPTNEVVYRYIIISTVTALLFDLGYTIGVKTKTSGNLGRKYLYNIECSDKFDSRIYCFILFVLLFVWIAVIINEYRSYNGSLISFLLPSRKQNIKSGMEGTIQVLFPEMIISLVYIRRWNEKHILRYMIFPVLILLLSLSVGAQRRAMIQGIMYIAMLFVIRHIQGGKKSKEAAEKKKHYFLFIFLGIAFVSLIPLLWYARSFSSQLSRGGEMVNPFSLHSFTDLIFGSSSTGFDSTMVFDWYDINYGIPFAHMIRYIASFWLPRMIYPNKMMQITMMLKVARGDGGNISLFYINDLYFSFRSLSVITTPLIGFILSRAYFSAITKKKVSGLLIGLYMLSQIVLLFKNGVAAYATAVITFTVVFKICLFLCNKRIRIIPE